MNKNEKKMMLALGKALVHQLDLNLSLVELLSSERAVEFKRAQERIEKEIDLFVELVRVEWNSDEQN